VLLLTRGEGKGWQGPGDKESVIYTTPDRWNWAGQVTVGYLAAFGAVNKETPVPENRSRQAQKGWLGIKYLCCTNMHTYTHTICLVPILIPSTSGLIWRRGMDNNNNNNNNNTYLQVDASLPKRECAKSYRSTRVPRLSCS
jgi:hypothetical protein